MVIIWYNAHQQTYKCGSPEEFADEIKNSDDTSAFEVLMKFKGNSHRVANQVLKQLNLLNDMNKIQNAKTEDLKSK